MAVTINADNGVSSGSAGLKQTADSTGVLALQTNGTTAVSISTGQVVTLAQPLPVASGGTGVTSAGANGNVLTSNGTTWVSAAAGGFAAGTVLLFYQAAAPTGWTQVTTAGLDDSALRIVTGTGGTTGGSVAFSTAFASQTPAGTVSVAVSAGTLAVGVGTLSTTGGSVSSFTLATTNIPAHSHTIRIYGGGTTGGGVIGTTGNTPGDADRNTGNTGGGTGHSHGFTNPTISGSPSLSGSPSITSATFTGTAINLAVKYVNIILCSKN